MTGIGAGQTVHGAQTAAAAPATDSYAWWKPLCMSERAKDAARRTEVFGPVALASNCTHCSSFAPGLICLLFVHKLVLHLSVMHACPFSELQWQGFG